MRRGHIKRPRRRRVFPLRIIIPLVFLIIGVGAAYSLVTGNRAPEPRSEPIIIMPSDMEPFLDPEGYSTLEPYTGDPGLPIEFNNSDVSAGPMADERQDQFTSERGAGYRVNDATLRGTVNQFAANRANQCAGEIIVVTDDTPLNVRSGPSTANARLTSVQRGSRHNVLLWAPDAGNQSLRWFLLVDEGSKTVMGWVRSDFCDAVNIVYAN